MKTHSKPGTGLPGLRSAPMRSLLISCLFALLLVGCTGNTAATRPASPPSGGDGDSGNSGGSGGSTAVLINLGDIATMPADSSPTVDQIVSFELTIESVVVRSSNGGVSELLSNPRRLELSRLLLKHEPLLLANVSQGNYSGVVVKVSNPVVSFIDSSGILHEDVAASLTSPTETINLPFSIGSTPVFFILRPLLASSVSFGGGDVVTVTPQFDAFGPAEVQNGAGIVNDLVGRVRSMGSSSFTIDVTSTGYVWEPDVFTFATDSSTQFQGVTGLNELSTGMTVEVDAVFYSDGTLRANKVELENNLASAVVVEGIARSLAPAQLQVMVREVHGPGDVTLPAVGKALTVDANASTQFRLESEHVDLNNLNFTPTFDALTVAAGQNVRAAAASGSATTIADQIKLEEQSLDGIAGALTAGSISDQYSFPLNLAADSGFAQLTGQTSVLVTLQPSTSVGIGDPLSPCITCIGGNHVRVRGLLFVSGGQYHLVAEIVGP